MQKYVFKGIPVFLVVLSILSILSIHLGGCDESGTVDPNTNQQVIALLTGNVVSFWGEPKANIKVSTDSATVYTDAEGNFSIPNVAAPYNLYISDSARSEYNVMKELTTEQVKFVFTSLTGGFTNTSEVKVLVPQNAFGNINASKFVFTDGNYLNAYGFVNTINGFETVRLNGYNSVTGRLYVVGYRVVNDKTEAYENFGYKDVTLTTGGQVTVNFDSADIAFNPGETTISGTFTNYEPSATLFKVFSISFGKYYTPNYATQILFEQSGLTADFSYVVPSNIPGFFKPMVFMQSSTPQSTQRNRRLSIDPGTTGGSYPLAVEPTLLEPPNGANVNLSTQFTFTPGSEEGIYILRIYNGQISYSIYTDDLSMTLESLSKLGFSFSTGTTYTWSVIKIGPNSTLDDYAGNPLRLSQFSSTSESRTFTGQ